MIERAPRPDIEALSLGEVAAFRRQHQQTSVGKHYSGWVHLGFTSLGAIFALGAVGSQLNAIQPIECITVPLAFLVANLVEHQVHRGPMHRPTALRVLYARHTLEHHRYFTEAEMVAESHRDFQMVLFPPVMLVFFLGFIALPLSAGLYFLLTPNVGFLFALTAIAYFLSYEWLHLAYHLPPDGWIGRMPFVAGLRQHHTIHHDQRLMSRWNFNVTFPIADRIFKTYRHNRS